MTHVSLFSSKGDDASGALLAHLEEVSLKEIHQLMAAMGQFHLYQLAIVNNATEMPVTTDTCWALTMCQTPCAKCFAFIISYVPDKPGKEMLSLSL